MISKVLLAIGLAALMVVTGFSSFIYLGAQHSRAAKPPETPTQATPRAQAFTLPGTLFLVQSGAIYSLSAGRFHQLTAEQGWTQPSIFPDGSKLLVVKRSFFYSDVWVLSRLGRPLSQLTHNIGPARNPDTGVKNWSFYPRLTRDGRTIFMSYDEPKFGYEVDMSIWAMPVAGTIRQARLWTNSNPYTGGDMQPVPLPSGGILYTKYGFGSDQKLGQFVWLTTRAGAVGKALTREGDACAQPALSPDGRQVAMICTSGKQLSRLVIASFNGSSLGALKTVVSDQMVAQPTWAPDGSGIAYLAPAEAAGGFQLWFLPSAAYTPPAPSPSPTPTPTPGGPYSGELSSPSPGATPPPAVVKPIRVTSNVGFDATSPIAWAP